MFTHSAINPAYVKCLMKHLCISCVLFAQQHNLNSTLEYDLYFSVQFNLVESVQVVILVKIQCHELSTIYSEELE